MLAAMRTLKDAEILFGREVLMFPPGMSDANDGAVRERVNEFAAHV
jgi:hypothetical protein